MSAFFFNLRMFALSDVKNIGGVIEWLLKRLLLISLIKASSILSVSGLSVLLMESYLIYNQLEY